MPVSERHWASTVAGVIENLNAMNQESEAGFLAVGHELSQFLGTSKRIAADSKALAELISAEQGQQPCDALKHLLGQIERKEKSSPSAQLIPTLRELADQLRSCFSGFDGTAFAFKQLSTLGRIEIGRLNQQASGLNQLTGEMRSCSTDIRSRVGQFLDTAAQLDSRLDVLLAGITEFEEKEALAIPPLLHRVGASLEGFRGRQQQSEAAARDLGVHFRDLSNAISDVVMSIQSHDITRQRIEHISAALLSLSPQSGIASQSDPGPDEIAIVGLQLAQLEGVAHLFEACIASIDGGLSIIGERVGDMAAESTALVAQSSNASDTSRGEMQRSFVAIAEATQSCAALERGAHSSVLALGETIQQLVKALAEIDAVGAKLRLLALNTMIQARLLGLEGEPLKAVAGAVRELQLNCEGRSQAGTGILAKIGSAISSMSAIDDMQPVVDELGARIDDLQASARRSASASEDLGSLAAGLSSDVRKARGQFAVGRIFNQTVQRSCLELGLIVSEFQKDGPQHLSADWLAEHAQNYTMDSQRAVHERVLGQTEAAHEEVLCGEVELF